MTGGAMRLVAGPASDKPPSITSDGKVELPDSEAEVVPVPGVGGYYYECQRVAGSPPGIEPLALGTLVAQLLEYERDAVDVVEELSNRYEEIDLLYSISDVLGRTVGLEEAAATIAREVSSVVGAQRASILVFDPEKQVLRPVAGWGIDVRSFDPVPVSDQSSVAALAFSECRTIEPGDLEGLSSAGRTYRGSAFLSVPIVYPDTDGVQRPVGVINLTDRRGADAFDANHRKLVGAIAHQIGAAIENARLVTRDRERERVRRELELAHDLQLRLLASPSLAAAGADVAARCVPAESVGGDFFRILALPGSKNGVMLGDVSSHGFRAALIMALVLSAAGIQAAAAASPGDALERLLASITPELATTEMHLSLFYGVADAKANDLSYANAGHPHAFRISGDGAWERLAATAPPLGLADADEIADASVCWNAGADLLLLFSDGITEARSASGEVFGEERVLELVRSGRQQPAELIVETVLEAVSEFADAASDDRTILVLKA